jgi:hypothetical protein
MNKQKNKPTKQLPVTLFIAVLSLLATILLAMFVFTQEARTNMLYEQQYRMQIDDSYNSARIKFCYDNNIRPCTDDAITAWNTKHPEDAFNINKPQI